MANFMSKLFNYEKEGPGVSKEKTDSAFVRFFKVYKDKFWKLMLISVIYTVCLLIVGAICLLPYNHFFANKNPFAKHLEDKNVNSSIVKLAERYVYYENFSDEQLNAAAVYVDSICNTLNSIDETIVTDGFDRLDIKSLTAEQLNALTEDFDGLFSSLNLRIVEQEGDSSVQYYNVIDKNDYVTLTYHFTENQIHLTESVPRLYDMNRLVKILICLIPLILLGPIHAGITRVTRDFVRGEPVFLMSDMWDAIKKNWWQSFVISIVQYVGAFLLSIGWFYYNNLAVNSIMSTIGVAAVLLAIIIFVSMQFYIMLMQVTLDLKLGKIFKNAALFSVISLFKNLMIIAIVALLLAATFVLYIFGLTWSIIIPFLVIAWVFVLFGFIFYLISAVSYPPIQQYVIDPYYNENQAETSSGIIAADVNSESESRLEGEKDDESKSEYVYHNGRMVHRSVFEKENLFNDDKS